MSVLVERGRKIESRRHNCDEIIPWGPGGSGDEARRDFINGICQEDQLDTGG